MHTCNELLLVLNSLAMTDYIKCMQGSLWSLLPRPGGLIFSPFRPWCWVNTYKELLLTVHNFHQLKKTYLFYFILFKQYSSLHLLQELELIEGTYSSFRILGFTSNGAFEHVQTEETLPFFCASSHSPTTNSCIILTLPKPHKFALRSLDYPVQRRDCSAA